ncbi:NAD-dependent DNA ligase LigA [Mycoplasma sp. CSL7475-4]|uniref:NAD-dependent DNA ligase LigA n=1 Tax=Mycoplasma sp. CSL7475-4 TaxID=2973942 RepID=UPI00216B03F9|nr:NAD-dependent DNA ligase LigA [Mycoplasma sp. CSL7475-4]MCS4537109.1 NAD-dependent DNA ligase LigA [Mycoplasma sp. CSL7475-4]
MKQKIKQLTELINKWNFEYFIENNPSVSDLEYDKKLKELEDLENQYPEFIHPHSPTNKVGQGDNIFNSKFNKVTHQKPMLSLSKAYNFDEIIKHIDNLKKMVPDEEINFSVEPKIDGLSIALHYKNGYLIQALTRGNGIEGEEVTENIMQIDSIPKIIDYTDNLEVRGEVFMTKSSFADLNNKMLASGEKTFANPRNAASGTLRQLNAEIVKQRGLECYIYELVEPQKHNIFSQQQALKFFASLNIPVNPKSKLVDVEELEDEIESFAEIKNKLDYDADGLVIKLNNLTFWDKLGATAKFPKHSIAFKYEVESVSSKILNISTTVGRTGKITYVAHIEPVNLNQTTVKKATMHNYNFIKEMNVNIGDEVTIIKAGEIIPKVIALFKKNVQGVFAKANFCPSCKQALVEIEGNVDQFCINEKCEEKVVNSIYHFASRQSLNIVGLGLTTVKDLYKNGFLQNIQDIYSLQKHQEAMQKLPRYGELKIQNLLNNIEKSKFSDFSKVIFALGIKHIGIRAAKLISQKYGNFTQIINDTNLANIQFIENIGPKISESLLEYVYEERNKELMLFLDSIFTYSNKNIEKGSKLIDKTFVITGKLTNNRDYYVDLIEKNGGHVASSVSSKTSYLLCGEDAGSKKDKAIKLNIEILSEEMFNNLIK